MWEDKTYFQVAVFWPIKGSKTQGDYGGITECKTLAEADREREKTIDLGYASDCVHIRKIVVERIK